MISFIVKVALIQALFYMVYFLLLRDENNYQFKRFFLLGSVVLSFFLPLINIPIPSFSAPVQNINTPIFLDSIVISEAMDRVENGAKLEYVIDPFGYAYLLISGVLLVTMIGSIIKIIRLYRESRPTHINGMNIRIHDNIKKSFSFFRWIFSNEMNSSIIAHEQAHVRLLHSIDIIILHLSRVVLWWSPLSWIATREIKLIHEFQADQLALESSDIKDYRRLLISASMASHGWNLASSFHDGALLKRLKAMATINKHMSKWKISTLGVLVAAIIFFSCAEQELKEIAENTYESVEISESTRLMLEDLQSKYPDAEFKVVDMLHEANEDFAELKKKLAKVSKDHAIMHVNPDGKEDVVEIIIKENAVLHEITREEQEGGSVYRIVDNMPEFPGGMTAFYDQVVSNLQYPKQARRMGIEGKVFVEFVIDKEGNLIDPKVVKGIGAGCDVAALKAISVAPKFKPGTLNGENVKVKMVLPIQFSLGEKTDEKELVEFQN